MSDTILKEIIDYLEKYYGVYFEDEKKVSFLSEEIPKLVKKLTEIVKNLNFYHKELSNYFDLDITRKLHKYVQLESKLENASLITQCLISKLAIYLEEIEDTTKIALSKFRKISSKKLFVMRKSGNVDYSIENIEEKE